MFVSSEKVATLFQGVAFVRNRHDSLSFAYFRRAGMRLWFTHRRRQQEARSSGYITMIMDVGRNMPISWIMDTY